MAQESFLRVAIGLTAFGIGCFCGFMACFLGLAWDSYGFYSRGFDDARQRYESRSPGSMTPTPANQSGSGYTPP